MFKKKCPSCGAKNSKERTVCMECGASLASEQVEQRLAQVPTEREEQAENERPKSPPRMNVFLLLIISFITLAIYIPVRFLRRKNWLNSLLTSNKLGSRLATFVLVIYCISAILIFVSDEVLSYGAWESIDDLITWVGVACIEILAFQVRRILIQHYNEKLGMNISFSSAGTFFFTILYLQYKMNRLPISGEISVTAE